MINALLLAVHYVVIRKWKLFLPQQKKKLDTRLDAVAEMKKMDV